MTEAKKARMISEAQEEAERIVGEGRKRAETERRRYIAGVGDEIAQMIVSSAEKLLVAESNAKTDGALYDKYLSLAKDEVAPLTEEQKGELSERLKNSQDSAPHSRGEVADIIGEAAASAIMAQGAASDSAVYDQFLSEVSKKGDGNE